MSLNKCVSVFMFAFMVFLALFFCLFILSYFTLFYDYFFDAWFFSNKRQKEYGSGWRREEELGRGRAGGGETVIRIH